MKHLGDITKIKGCNAPVVDCIIGGSPCQDLSVAGKRAGLAGERSGLYMEQIRIIKEMRHKDEQRGRTGESIRPRYMVWENVPGAFSSNQGKDFAAVIEEAIKVAEPEAPNVPVPEKGWPTSGCFMGDTWSVAWRVLDAQFWGVPQRRRRIALVADFGGQSAPEILFIRKGVSRDIDESESARKATAGDAQNRTGANDRDGERADSTGGRGLAAVGVFNAIGGNAESGQVKNTFPTLTNGSAPGFGNAVAYACSSKQSLVTSVNILTPWDSQGNQVHDGTGNHIYPCLRGCGGAGYQQGYVLAQADDQHHPATGLIDSARGQASIGVAYGWPLGFRPENTRIYEETATTLCNGTRPGFTTGVIQPVSVDAYNQTLTGDKTKTLNASACDSDHIPVVIEPASFFPQRKAESQCFRNDGVNNTLTNGTNPGFQNAIVVPQGTFQETGFGWWNDENVGATLRAMSGGDAMKANLVVERYGHYIVRRLTPLECERLQGYPDGWTDIGEWVDSKGKKHKEADSPRYKALGNSIAIPPWKWILKRLCACYERDATMASLFDGIGGFPYIWEQLNGKGSCLWASEIEEFPMAVTKLRFGG